MKRIIVILLFIFITIFYFGCGNDKEKLAVKPTEEYVIECLKKIPNILDIEAVTEDNDPNGLLNKQGGYYSQIYFSLNIVSYKVYGKDLIDKGTDAGGSIEIYNSVNDANKRNDYLSLFDGSFNSGSHIVYGTCVIRVSRYLSYSIQKTIESNIINALCNETHNIIEINPKDLGLEYTVTFVVDGEKTEQTFIYGEFLTFPPDPVKEGYKFVGWFVGEEEYHYVTVTGDLELTAKFEELPGDESVDWD